MSVFNNLRKALFPTSSEMEIKSIREESNQLRAGVSKRTPLSMRVDRRVYRIELLLKTWKQAVEMAMNPERPIRLTLYQLYAQVMEDDHLLSEVRTARNTVKMGGFKVYRKNVEDEDAKELIDTMWFRDFIEYCVDTELYGHSLVEMSIKDGEILSCTVIPREHIRPEAGLFVIKPTDMEGFEYRRSAEKLGLIELGKTDDLGLLKVLSKLVIKKDYSLSDWGRRNERFGMPFIVVKTAERQQAELDKKEYMLKNFGSNAYAILDDMDDFDLIEPISNTGGGHKSYDDFIDRMERGISKLVNGQTSSSEEKAFVGSAEVHERVLNKYTLARMRDVKDIINDQLFPFLVNKGYPLLDARFEFVDLEETDDDAQLEGSDASDINQDGKKKA